MVMPRLLARGLLYPFGTAMVLAGCAATPPGSTVQVMPGPGKSLEAFQLDNNTCKAFAAQQVQGQADAANQRSVGVALLTTVLGAGLGAATGGLTGDAGAGAAVGAAAGAGGGAVIGASSSSNDQAAIQQQYDIAFSQCMYTKGEQVPGYTPVVAAGYGVPAVGAAPPDPTVRATQVELNRLGYLHEPADGYAGSHTRSAISSYEQANGLRVDGTASSRLLAKLQATPASAPAVTAAAPAGWVAPTGSSPAPVPAAAQSSGWVAPTKTQ